MISSKLARVEVHALQREFALGKKPERQLHHRLNHVVAPRILVATLRLAMKRLLEYLFSLFVSRDGLLLRHGVEAPMRLVSGLKAELSTIN